MKLMLVLTLLFSLTMLSGCGSATQSAIHKGDFVTAEAKFKEKGLEGKELYMAMGNGCMNSNRHLEAAEYFIKAGMDKKKAYEKVASRMVWRYENAVIMYRNHGSYRNYLSLVQRVNKSRLHRDLKARMHAIQAFKAYKAGKWPSAGGKVFSLYMKCINAKIAHEAMKLQIKAAKKKKAS